MTRVLSTLLTWWVVQLSDAMPTLSTARKRAAIVATIDGQHLQLHEREMPYADLGQIPLRQASSNHHPPSAEPLLTDQRNRRVVLRLPESAGVRRTLSLPAAAEPHLHTITANELDRLTPWRPEQAIFSAVVLASAADIGLDAEIVAVPRFAFSSALECLQSARLDLIGVLLDHPRRPPDFIAIERTTQPAAGASRRRAMLGAALVAFAILFAAVAFGQRLWAISDLQAHMERLEADAKRIQAMQTDLQKLTARIYYAVAMKLKAPSAIVTLEVLSRLLPDDCWLDSVTIADDQVTLEGHASDALALLPLLISSGHFDDAHFNSEVLRDAESEIERFSLTARLIPHAAP